MMKLTGCLIIAKRERLAWFEFELDHLLNHQIPQFLQAVPVPCGARQAEFFFQKIVGEPGSAESLPVDGIYCGAIDRERFSPGGLCQKGFNITGIGRIPEQGYEQLPIFPFPLKRMCPGDLLKLRPAPDDYLQVEAGALSQQLLDTPLYFAGIRSIALEKRIAALDVRAHLAIATVLQQFAEQLHFKHDASDIYAPDQGQIPFHLSRG